ncbi:hypothetical protein [Mesorhizobium sp.]|uniref:hypothetical protein n=1 Tax=Mesorhizobium sp. TaxID=1871066 RepID=UPI0025808754|nr:hypothetical protein [Mesorhizobium sp.]
MRFGYSAHLCQDVNLQVWAAAQDKGILNVTAVAEAVRLRNLAENVALEDVECLVLQAAQFYGAAMEFDSLTVFEPGNVDRHSLGCDALPGRATSMFWRTGLFRLIFARRTKRNRSGRTQSVAGRAQLHERGEIPSIGRDFGQ